MCQRHLDYWSNKICSHVCDLLKRTPNHPKKRKKILYYIFSFCVGKSVGKLCNELIIRLYVTPWGSTKAVQK